MNRSGQLLKLIGNETRRRILALLSEEPHYISELSKKLDVAQPAILKHLALLKEAGLIKSFMRESRLGAPRKYFRISDSVNLEVTINPRGFRVVEHPPRIRCPTYIQGESVMRQLTDEINRARDLGEKTAKARRLMSEVDKLLSCNDYDEGRWDCRNCQRITSLRRRVSEVIIQASTGDVMSGLHTLIGVINKILPVAGTLSGEEE